MRLTWILAAVAALLAVGIAACDDTLEPPPPPVAGVFDAFIASPTGDAAGAMISLSAANVDRVTAGPGVALFTQDAGDRLYLIMLRSDPGPITFRVHVSDRTTALDPAVHQIVKTNNQLETSLAGFRVEVRR